MEDQHRPAVVVVRAERQRRGARAQHVAAAVLEIATFDVPRHEATLRPGRHRGQWSSWSACALWIRALARSLRARSSSSSACSSARTALSRSSPLVSSRLPSRYRSRSPSRSPAAFLNRPLILSVMDMPMGYPHGKKRSRGLRGFSLLPRSRSPLYFYVPGLVSKTAWVASTLPTTGLATGGGRCVARSAPRGAVEWAI